MLKLFSIYFAIIMSGTVDQIDGQMAIIELVAKDGHSHEVNLPLWMFPCRIEEGTKIWIKIKEDATIIYCGGK